MNSPAFAAGLTFLFYKRAILGISFMFKTYVKAARSKVSQTESSVGVI